MSKSIAIEPGLLELLQKVAGVRFFLRHSVVANYEPCVVLLTGGLSGASDNKTNPAFYRNLGLKIIGLHFHTILAVSNNFIAEGNVKIWHFFVSEIHCIWYVQPKQQPDKPVQFTGQ